MCLAACCVDVYMKRDIKEIYGVGEGEDTGERKGGNEGEICGTDKNK